MKAKAVHAAPLLLIVVFLCSFGVTLLPSDALGADADPYIVASIVQLFVLALPTLIFCRLRGGGYMKRLRLKMFGVKHAALMFYSLLFMFFGSAGINYLMYSLFPSKAAAAAYGTPDGFAGGLYLVLTMAIIPAITEEFLFRGVILTEYGDLGVPASVLLSSLTFAMLHFSFIRLPVYFFCGLVLAAVLYATRSLFAVMLVHMLNNTATIFFGDLVYRVVSSQGIVIFCLVLVALMLLSAVMMFGECGKLYAEYGILNESSDYTGSLRKGRGTAGIFHSIFTPLFTVLTVIFIIIAAIAL